ncbi:pentapeptide repeat-containing protein [Pseudoprimorskyibacter insulae]|uniref:Secreted effector protein PipB2 n=1 Tax=Pseudoprimorskyibacter insulae TaxID=1695997 RepID=A0A2R8AY00_9RHOB|nr:pentapeptide repeat-containing protein [Pseudoprimorskyibacter insulae]SPF80880.1 hypothetical protein PRI8871_02693 [Pseudoprimorskyibacter insulae]
MMQTTITIPVAPETLITAAGLATLCLILWFALRAQPEGEDLDAPWLGRVQATMGMDKLGSGVFLPVAMLWLVVFLLLSLGLFYLIADTITRPLPVGSNVEDGDRAFRFHITQLAALTTVLGAVIALPVTLLRLGHSSRQTDATEQRLITEQINKAVEGLGAEKKVDRIGRIVSYIMPETVRFDAINERDALQDLERHLEGTEQHWGYRFNGVKSAREDQDTGEMYLGYDYDIWNVTNSEIQWFQEDANIPRNAKNPKHKEWQVFSETVPNLEVRIGAIYALERISQASDRDHVRVMEILCAYVRETSPKASTRLQRLKNRNKMEARADIQAAIDVIGRRGRKSISLERQNNTRSEHGYRLDLRFANLQNYDLSKLNLSNARFNGANLNGVDLFQTNLDSADFRKATFGLTTKMMDTSIYGAAFPETDLVLLKLTHDQIEKAFGDRTTLLSDDTRAAFGEYGQPAHWLDKKAGWKEFDAAWRKWQREVLKMNPNGTKPDE